MGGLRISIVLSTIVIRAACGPFPQAEQLKESYYFSQLVAAPFEKWNFEHVQV